MLEKKDKNQNKEQISLTEQELQTIIAAAVREALHEQENKEESTSLAKLIQDLLSGQGPPVESLLVLLDHFWEDSKVRWRGHYETDDFGMDPGFTKMVKPLLDAFYQHYFRCDVAGEHNIPAQGGALIIANHSGFVPWDGMMLKLAVLNEHPQQRNVRVLFLNWLNKLPFIGDFLHKTGNTFDRYENAIELLNRGELLAAFPEGQEGTRKLYRHRYRIQRFRHQEFIRAAIRKSVPLIPCAIMGAAESYPLLNRVDWSGEVFGLPFLPITPQFPGIPTPLSLWPLPSKWRICFLEPVSPSHHAERFATEEALINHLSQNIRTAIQQKLDQYLKERTSYFR
ncbi:lysophospholipid acyltransferase family protein [candidate division CSSED10-310 bacterium]|uniref:Lysophospholipid acyltransferase family protein n=1 Tax=candidate division CSSED10-310 bacterium TaxID=2855610 RepID=A0ABV6Z1M4_UNCC1